MTIDVTMLRGGHCTNIEKIAIKDGALKGVKFPALFALLKHPKHGPMLFDTGYSKRFFVETKPFPFRLYALLTPVSFQEKDGALYQLRERGIEAKDVRYVFVSHFHADHVSGLRDFPNATYLCFRKAYEAVKNKRGVAALREGFVPGLLPDDFESRAQFLDDEEAVALPEEVSPFTEGYDVFGDGQFYAVDLSGHAVGQFGLFFRDQKEQMTLLSADATWSSRAYREGVPPHKIASLIMGDKKGYKESFEKLCLLHRQNPHVRILPSHCEEVPHE